MVVQVSVVTVAVAVAVAVIIFLTNVQPIAGDMPGVDQLVKAAVKSPAVRNSALSALGVNLKAISEKVENIANTVETVIERMSAASSTVVGAANGQVAVDIIKPKLPLDQFFRSHCLEKIQLAEDSSVTSLYDGQMTLESEHFNFKGSSLDEGLESTYKLKMSLEFQDLKFSYSLLTPSAMVKTQTRQGFVELTLKGTSSVNLLVKVPSDKSELKKLTQSNKCFIDVIEETVKFPNALTKTDFLYNSVAQNIVGQGPTGNKSVTLILKNKDLFKKEVEKSLRKAVEQLISVSGMFCDPQNVTVSEDLQCEDESTDT